MSNVQLTTCLLCLVLFCDVSGTAEGAVSVTRSDDVSTAIPQTLGELETCQASLMMMMQAELTSLKNTVSSLENNVTSLKNTVRILEGRLNNVQNASSETVAFTARISSDRDRNNRGLALGYQQTVVFNDVLTNVGNAYNNHTGIFTAPVNGTYVFFLIMTAVAKWTDPNSRDIYLVIVKNGAVLDKVFSHGGYNFHDQGSTLASTQLRQGDHVWVRQHSGNAVRGDTWTVFTGYLLHAQ